MDDDFEAEQQRVMEALEPYFERLTGICESAVDLYNSETTPKARAEHDTRAALSAIYSHAWTGYLREFDEEPGFHFMNIKGLNVLNIRDVVVARAKRVDSDGRHANHDSKQQRDFDRQLAIPGLPPAAVRVVIGYELDPAFSKVERVIVRRPMGKSTVWSAQIVSLGDIMAWQDITPVRLAFGPGGRAARGR
jgi:hypothetical protein